MFKLIKFLLFILSFVSGEVEVRGLKNIRIDEIKGFLPSENIEDKIDKSLKLLAKTGWFRKLEYYKDVDSGRIILIVEEVPLIRNVKIDGVNESDELAKDLEQFKLQRLSSGSLEKIKKFVRDFFDKKGYPNAEVTEVVDESKGEVSIKVKKNERVKISNITATGENDNDKRVIAELFSDFEDQMSLSEYKWWSSWLTGRGYFSKQALESGENRLREFLKQQGYVDSRVEVKYFMSTAKKADVNFRVYLGDRYRVGSIDVDKGEKIESVRSGDYFNVSVLRQDLDKLARKYKDEGFAFVNVIPNFDVDRERRIVNIKVEIDEGKPQRISEIKFEGNKKTRDRVLRRELRITEGELFSQSKLERTKRRLLRTGYFSDVKFESFRKEGTNDLVDVIFSVKEAQTGSLSVGAGYSTLDSFFLNLKLSERNVFGTGIGAYFSTYIGDEFNSFNLRLVEPRIFDSFYSGSIEGFRNRRDYDDFKRYQTGARLSLGYDFEEFESLRDFSVKLFFDWREVEIADVKKDEAASFIKESAGKGVSSSLGSEIRRLSVDRAIRPTEGSVQSLALEYGGLGGDFEFFNVGFSNNFYYSLYKFEEGGKVVFVNRTSLDIGKGLNGQRYPLFKRYFPGGPKSVRGYKPRSMGPREGQSEYGGAKQLVNNAELVLPLAEEIGLDFVCFFDLGEAFDDEQDIEFSALRKAYGAGLRWDSPIGPLSLELGFPVDKREGDKSMVVNFSAGADF
ncbi:MAG: outer membrane protein assembly factor BamA [Deltaproteobacteria bacterium]|nr:outer membrane protein assembly factor BamA [Deltaproteobacteria bacterium]